MQDLGISILFKGINFQRLMGGLGSYEHEAVLVSAQHVRRYLHRCRKS